MATYGVSPKDLFPYVQLDQSQQRDWSVELLVSLATAFYCYEVLRHKYPDSTNLDSRSLVGDAVERAWREALFVRSHLPEDAFDDIQRPFSMSKLGVIISDEKETIYIQRGNNNGDNTQPETGQKLVKKRVGAREYKRKRSR